MQKTIINLGKAFVGESQARNRYAAYAKIARKEGLEEISANFELTANQEAEHAKWLMRIINNLKKDDQALKFETEAPTILASTKENLKAAISGENFEYTSMYPEFANTADEENLPKIANRLRAIAKAEANHEKRYQNFLLNLENKTTFKKESGVEWQCRKCGYTHTGKEAIEECPSCGHPQAYFEVICK
ncbi:MAG: rubrerythrin family protein [Candidatus Moranbacteria bacterium]|nr:rubrerythrin family protein [Candidatus Moranbacteria bacterium]